MSADTSTANPHLVVGDVDLEHEVPVRLEYFDHKWWIVSFNEGGYNATYVDLDAILVFVREHEREMGEVAE